MLTRLRTGRIKEKAGGWHGDPCLARWGCFLPDLTRLASGSSTTNLPGVISGIGRGNARGLADCGSGQRPIDRTNRRSAVRSSRVGIWRELRRVQPVHLLVEPRPKQDAFLPEHFAVALEAVLLVDGIERIVPRERCRGFKPGQRRFQARADRRPL